MIQLFLIMQAVSIVWVFPIYIFVLYRRNLSLGGCTPARLYSLGSNTVKHAVIGIEMLTDTDTLGPQVLTHHTARRKNIVSHLSTLFFNALITGDCMVCRSSRLPPFLSLSHLFVTTAQEHDSSRIRPMESVSLMGQTVTGLVRASVRESPLSFPISC